jgi:hypothetical protein
MKKLLFLLLFAIPIFCKAQTGTTANKQVAYCIAIVANDGSKFDMMFDDGSTKKRDGIKVKDAKGKIMTFDSKVSALNYMSKLGWTLVSSYTPWNVDQAIAFVFERPVNQ